MDPDRFVRAWQRSRRVSHVARRLGMTKSHVRACARVLRFFGVELKPMRRTPPGCGPSSN